MTDLNQAGVDNLPDFFFMNVLKDVIRAGHSDDDDEMNGHKTQETSNAVCSTADCTKPVMKYCTKCQFMCQQCYDDHQSLGITKCHHVIPASEGETFIASQLPPYPPCNHHSHQVMDLFCSTCSVPICVTCSQINHRSHDCIELVKRATVCKTKLEKMCERTNWLIEHVIQAIDKTTGQIQQAETDINNMIDNVKTTFKEKHLKLDEEEKKILLELQEAHRRMKKTSDVIVDSQMMTLAILESLIYSQTKLAEKSSAYDCVSGAASIQKDLDTNLCKELPVKLWKSQSVSYAIGDSDGGLVEFYQSEMTKTKGEISRFRLQNQNKYVIGMVVYRECVYTLHAKDHMIYKYNPDGSLGNSYKHTGGEGREGIEGISMMMNGDCALLVISDFCNKALVWIEICDDDGMKHHHIQQLDYRPFRSYDDGGELVVSDARNKILRYGCDSHEVDVTTVAKDVGALCVARYGDDDQYVVTDWAKHQVAIIEKDGQVKTRYVDELHGLKLGEPYNIITDQQGRILICDDVNNNVLVMSKGETIASRTTHEKFIQHMSGL